LDYLKVSVRAALILFAIGILLSLLACQPQVAQAATGPDCQTMADGVDYRLTNALKLSDGLPESPSRYVNGQLDASPFVTTSAEVTIGESTKVLLSGSKEGSGFVADDLILLTVQPSGQSKQWDFRSADFMHIIPASSPQEVTELFTAGTNQLQIDVYDLLGPVHSASELWLLMLDPCNVVAASAPTKQAHTVIDAADIAAVNVEAIEQTLQPTPQTAVVPESEKAVASAVEAETTVSAEAMLDALAEEMSKANVTEPVDVVENVEVAVQATAVPSESVTQTQNIAMERQRSPLLRGFTIGLMLALLLIGAGAWRVRETIMAFYQDAQPSLMQLRRKAKQLVADARAWLESLQD